MAELSVFFWLFVGAPIIVSGIVALLFIWINEMRFRREMRELMDEHRGWK